ncbi:MAG: flagellar basal-body rod protein FlgB [Rhodothermales bacterium]|jgi:flagellar basal-body rod protein FlgB
MRPFRVQTGLSRGWHEAWVRLESVQLHFQMIDNKVGLLSNAMATYARRMDAISGNIANLDTPGYRKVSVSFEDRLQQAMRGPRSSENASQIGPTMELGDDAPVLEDELMDMADTQMRNQLVVRALKDHFGMVRTGITGRTG